MITFSQTLFLFNLHRSAEFPDTTVGDVKRDSETHLCYAQSFMRRFFALIFLSLYLYNIVGYLAVFSVIQYRIRSEVRKLLKESVPDSQLHHFSFHTGTLERGEYQIQWIEDHEFRREGQMFDVVRSFVVNDTTYVVCINDVEEEKLFEHLDNHVKRQMEHNGQSGKFDSFKDVFQDSHRTIILVFHRLDFSGEVIALSLDGYLSIALDVPFLPPRFATS